MARNMAAGLQKQVDAGQMTKEAAIAEFGKRANSLTFDKGNGYLFGTTDAGTTVLSPRSQAGRHQPHGCDDQRPLHQSRMGGRGCRQGRAYHGI